MTQGEKQNPALRLAGSISAVEGGSLKNVGDDIVMSDFGKFLKSSAISSFCVLLIQG